MSATLKQREFWKLFFKLNKDIPEELVAIPESVTMAHLLASTPFCKSRELAGFLNPPPHARVYKDYVYHPPSECPNVFGDLRKSKERCAFLREHGLRV
jgi:hypothetical protein